MSASENRSLLLRPRGYLSIFFLLVLLGAVCGAAMAQSTAVLRGTVVDATGAAVPHAKVVAKNQATGAEWNTESGNLGIYLLPSLPIGLYELDVTAKGFETSVVRNITLDAALRSVSEQGIAAAAAKAAVIPGTTSKPTPASVSAAISSAARPKISGSPLFSRITRRPESACAIISA